MSLLAPTLQAFFTERLIGKKHASAHTIAAYRDTIRTRNARLAAIRSLFRYAALRHPEQAATIQRVLAIPTKPHDQALVTFLTDPELQALLDAPDQSTWIGRRDHGLILLAAQTGLRTGELIGLSGDLRLGTGAHVSCLGKGRKQRITPLTKQTVTLMRAWIRERAGQPGDPLFATSTGRPLTRDALERRRAKTPPPPPPPARHSPPRRSRHTCCATLPRCACCTPASTPL